MRWQELLLVRRRLGAGRSVAGAAEGACYGSGGSSAGLLPVDGPPSTPRCVSPCHPPSLPPLLLLQVSRGGPGAGGDFQKPGGFQQRPPRQ